LKHEDVLEILEKRGAILTGHFVLSSGQRASWYIDLRRVLLGLRRSKSNVDRLKLVGKLPASLGVEIPVNSEPRTGLSMGEHAAITAKQMGIKRVDQDELAAASHRNMAANAESMWTAVDVRPHDRLFGIEHAGGDPRQLEQVVDERAEQPTLDAYGAVVAPDALLVVADAANPPLRASHPDIPAELFA